MRYLYSLLSLFLLSSAYASTHNVIPFVNYNFEQATGAGYGLGYNYTLLEGLEVEGIYIHSNLISYQSEKNKLTGKFNNAFLGFNAFRSYNDDLRFKFGAGVGYTHNSSNETLVTDKKLNPYIKFTFNYRIAKNAAFEFGQITQKVTGDLSLSHSAFMGLSWKFGSNSSTSISHTLETVSSDQQQQRSLALKPSENSITEPAQTDITSPKLTSTPWYLQLGAFKNVKNAELALSQYQKDLPELKLHIHLFSSLYRILSEGLITKNSAIERKKDIDVISGVSSYVVYIP